MRAVEQRWQPVSDNTNLSGMGNPSVSSSRLKVAGGWIYRTIVTASSMNGGTGAAVSQTFVADEA